MVISLILIFTVLLKKAMFKIENSSEEKLKEMGELSFELSKKFSVENWVNIFNSLIEN